VGFIWQRASLKIPLLQGFYGPVVSMWSRLCVGEVGGRAEPPSRDRIRGDPATGLVGWGANSLHPQRLADPSRRGMGIRELGYINAGSYILGIMSKHLVDIDEKALSAARSELGTRTIKETVNRALRQAVKDRDERVKKAFEVLASTELARREDAWR
jgi:Arc/MetJ family transcription regulator